LLERNRIINILFIHGTNSSSEVWKEQEHYFKSLGHKTQAIDLPSHGSKRTFSFSFRDSFMAIEKAIFNFRDKEKVILVGTSLGGYLAMDFASKNPDKVKGVIASSCATDTKLPILKNIGAIAIWFSRNHSIFRIKTESWRTSGEMLKEVSSCDTTENIRQLTKKKIPLIFISGAIDPLRIGERRIKKLLPKENYLILRRCAHNFLKKSQASLDFSKLLHNFSYSIA